jgi:hypothetical protein
MPKAIVPPVHKPIAKAYPALGATVSVRLGSRKYLSNSATCAVFDNPRQLMAFFRLVPSEPRSTPYDSSAGLAYPYGQWTGPAVVC